MGVENTYRGYNVLLYTISMERVTNISSALVHFSEMRNLLRDIPVRSSDHKTIKSSGVNPNARVDRSSHF